MEVHVTVRSSDGSVEHPFKETTTIAEVKSYAYDHIKPNGISLQATFLTFAGTRVVNEQLTLAHFAQGEHKKTALFVMTWENQAG